MNDRQKDGPIASLIMDGMRSIPDEQLIEMLLTGFIYQPFVPLQVTSPRLLPKGQVFYLDYIYNRDDRFLADTHGRLM